MKRISKLFFAAFATVLLASSANATVIYEETSPAPSTNDIDTPQQTFNLAVGLSEVIGNYGENGPTLPNGAGKDGGDAFTVNVPANTTLNVTAFRDWNLVSISAGDPSKLEILNSSFDSLSTFTTVTGHTAGTALGGPLAGGTSYSFLLSGADPGIVNEWSLQFNVQAAAIPEPSSVGLLVLGFAGMVTGIRRRLT